MTILVTFQDYGGPGNAGVGLNLSSLIDANNYSLTKYHQHGPAAYLVTSISVTPGNLTGSQLVTLQFNGGKYLRGGHYFFTVHSVSPTDLTGVRDIAGNALDGEFYGYFPSGNNAPGGDFIAELDAVHHTVLRAQDRDRHGDAGQPTRHVAVQHHHSDPNPGDPAHKGPKGLKAEKKIERGAVTKTAAAHRRRIDRLMSACRRDPPSASIARQRRMTP